MKRVTSLFVALIVVLGGAFAAYRWGRGQGTPVASASELPPNSARPTTRPVMTIDRVLIISIDGARPDLLLRAKMPTIRRLMDGGSYSFWAQTVPAGITLPSHTSMLTGVTPERHGVSWNSDAEETKDLNPKVPTLFEVARQHGLTTAMVAGKSKFDALGRPGRIDRSSVTSANDDQVASTAIQWVRDYKPRVFFVHFAGADLAGHGFGWGSPQQIATLEHIDELLGQLLAALDELKFTDSTLVIVTADHGGAGRSHGPDDPRSRHIPWIASGPGVRKNLDLTFDQTLAVRTEDTFATACHMLGLAVPGEIDGKPVLQILEQRELLQPAR